MIVNSDDAEITTLPEWFIPTDKDVICGWARQHHRHAGNKRFRRLVEHSAPFYVAARTKLEKTQVIAAVVDKVRKDSPGGGFVKRDFQTGRWFEIGDDKARDKVGHAIRRAIEEGQKTGVSQSQSKQAKALNKKKSSEIDDLDVFASCGSKLSSSMGMLQSTGISKTIDQQDEDKMGQSLFSSAFQGLDNSDSLVVPPFLYQSNSRSNLDTVQAAPAQQDVVDTPAFGNESSGSIGDFLFAGCSNGSNAAASFAMGQNTGNQFLDNPVLPESSSSNLRNDSGCLNSFSSMGLSMDGSLGNSAFANNMAANCVADMANRLSQMNSVTSGLKTDFNPVDDSPFFSQQLCQTAGNFVGTSNQFNSNHDNGFQQGSCFGGPSVNADGSFFMGSVGQNNSQMLSSGVDLFQGKLGFLGNDLLSAQPMNLPMFGTNLGWAGSQ